MWITFKTAFCAFMLWSFIKWRFTLWRTKRRRRNKVIVKPITPGEAMDRMNIKPDINPVVILANDNAPAPAKPDLVAVQPITTQAPVQQQTKARNNKMINEVTSAMVNLGMAKRKAKQHVQQCYDNMQGAPSLTDLLTYSIRSLST